MKTDKDKVIGLYCADKWENTNEMEGEQKDCIGSKPFLFYCLDNKI